MPSIKAQSRFYVNPYMWFVIFFVFFFLLYLLRSVLMPFVAGILLAYLLDPLTLKLQKCKMSRTWATVLVCFLMILIVLPAIFLFLGMVESQVTLLVQATPKYLALVLEKARPALQRLAERFPGLIGGNLEEMIKGNIGNGVKFAGALLKGLIANGFAFINLISLILITPIVTFYMLRDWDTFVCKFEGLLPKKSKKGIMESMKEINVIIAGFIRGQLSVCLILGLYYSHRAEAGRAGTGAAGRLYCRRYLVYPVCRVNYRICTGNYFGFCPVWRCDTRYVCGGGFPQRAVS